MKKLLTLIIISLLLILAACSNDDDKNEKEDKLDTQEITLDKDETVANDKVVVSVNDVDVKGDIYNAVYFQTKMRAYQVGQNLKEKEHLKEVTLNEIIAQELIKQEAKKQGVNVSDDEVKAEFDKIKSESGDKFKDYLKQYHLTEGLIKKQIRFSLTLQQYVEKNIEVAEVTDDDIKAAYDNLAKNTENMMKFEDAEPIIKDQLKQQREADALQAKVEKLMKSAAIKKNI